MKPIEAFTERNQPRARRYALIGSMGCLCLIVATGNSWAVPNFDALQGPDSTPIKLRTALHQEVVVHATAHRVYEAILSSKQFKAFSGEPAEIGAKPGGSISMFGGKITGRNIELVPDLRIVQAWRPGSWDPGIYSVVKFVLKSDGAKTTIILDHTGFPEGDYESLSDGWGSHYWKPLHKYFP
jgi:activator of HSP90 ATPase